MPARLLSLTLVIIWAYLWSARLLKQRTSAINVLFATVNQDKLSEAQLDGYLPLALDLVHAEDFYPQAVAEVNPGINISLDSAMAKFARIAPMPIFEQVQG